MKFLGFIMAVLLFGCANSGSHGGGVVQKADAKYPAWVLNPLKPGFQSVIGSAPVQDWGGHAAQYRVAEMQARKELAQMVRVHLQSTSSLREDVRAGKLSRDSEVNTRLDSSVDLSLQFARVIEEWTDPGSGVLYIWLVTPE